MGILVRGKMTAQGSASNPITLKRRDTDNPYANMSTWIRLHGSHGSDNLEGVLELNLTGEWATVCSKVCDSRGINCHVRDKSCVQYMALKSLKSVHKTAGPTYLNALYTVWSTVTLNYTLAQDCVRYVLVHTLIVLDMYLYIH